jgi:hypothetical protein
MHDAHYRARRCVRDRDHAARARAGAIRGRRGPLAELDPSPVVVSRLYHELPDARGRLAAALREVSSPRRQRNLDKKFALAGPVRRRPRRTPSGMVAISREFSAPGRIRASDPRIRSPPLCLRKRRLSRLVEPNAASVSGDFLPDLSDSHVVPGDITSADHGVIKNSRS